MRSSLPYRRGSPPQGLGGESKRFRQRQQGRMKRARNWCAKGNASGRTSWIREKLALGLEMSSRLPISGKSTGNSLTVGTKMWR